MNMDPSGDVSHVKVLLVDDEEAYATVLAKRLRRRGFDVRVALNGAQGIQAAGNEDFDVALLDLKTEDIDGLEVLILRAWKGRRIMVATVSAYHLFAKYLDREIILRHRLVDA